MPFSCSCCRAGSRWLLVLLVGGVGAGLVARRLVAAAWLGPLAALVAVAGVAALQQTVVATSPLAVLAEEGAVVGLRLEVTRDVRTVAGQYGDLQVAGPTCRASRAGGACGRSTRRSC